MRQVTGYPPKVLLCNSRKSTLHRAQVCQGVARQGVEFRRLRSVQLCTVSVDGRIARTAARSGIILISWFLRFTVYNTVWRPARDTRRGRSRRGRGRGNAIRSISAAAGSVNSGSDAMHLQAGCMFVAAFFGFRHYIVQNRCYGPGPGPGTGAGPGPGPGPV